MNPIKIITDSTCDFSLEFLKERGVDVIPLSVTINATTYRDCFDITTPELFKLVEEHDELPKTSAVSPAVFYETFQRYVNDGYDVIYIGIGSKLSSSYASACLSATEFEDRVFVIDSLNLSTGIGLQVLKIIHFRDQGLSAKEIVEKMKGITPNVQVSFAIKTMDYLYKGGRCSGVKFFIGRMLRLFPIIKMKDCVLNVHKTPRGKFTKALDIMIEEFKEKYLQGKVDLGNVLVTHACADESCKYIVNKLKEFMDEKYILTSTAGCVISSHCGPNCIGILYIEK